ncbi:feline leukemia virus subgroup C receptor-related protein 1-like [Paramacrobiotus metropolitanus]|uniref:feline leukemia virus subgroup C receptor-related protein 1-like n=1 Tax=Paramacrobiotus metropolitanus TaxID=2943436 RepID=UPI00244588B0|nr:feline leukemia virus subgroup C receptor-related protein 1-like [Paramacrobiotus metropolitanus]XP_055335393.1 feline leukemia virus subgroup C receptor-related protein 1-like [Paramacrobiotus metropolitanus]XP_055335394.1 feline leukemia virus subgroup C receptor-related protein 1-like [Paramacrobiotus metropolitanus]
MALDSDEEAEAKVPLQSAKSPKIVISTSKPADDSVFTAAGTTLNNRPNGLNNDNAELREYSSPSAGSPTGPSRSYQKMEPRAEGSPADLPKKRLQRRESHAFAFNFSDSFARIVRQICGKEDRETTDGDIQIVDESQPPLYRTTPRRWIMLAVFCLYSMSNAFQWIEYGIISDKIVFYYGVSPLSVDWLSMIYMLTYIPLVFPATWLLDKKGLRVVALIGSLGNFIGSAIKCFSAVPDRFVVTFVGQTVAAMSQIFILGLPARLAAVWFSAKEVSVATAFGVFGNQLGVALGFLLPPMLVPTDPNNPFHNASDPHDLCLQERNVTIMQNDARYQNISSDYLNCDTYDLYGRNLATLFYGSTALNGFLFLVVLFVFQHAPRYPPSPAQAAILQEAAESTYLNWIKILIRNWNFIILVVSYGINVGAFYAISTLLNQCILHFFPDENENAGRIGMTIVLAGLVGSFIGGLWLSWSGNYKTTTFVIYLLSFLCMIAFAIVLPFSILLIFIVAACLGFFMTGYLPVGFEFAAEITYPAPEGTSSGLLNCSAQLFGFLLTQLMGVILNETKDPVGSNGFIAGWLFIGTVMTFFIKPDLRRTNVTNMMTANKSAASLSSTATGNTISVPQIRIESIQMVPNDSHVKTTSRDAR